jgi:hypothetical protein
MTSTSTSAATSVSITDARIDADAREFAQQHDLVQYLNVALQLAVRHFIPIEPIWVELMMDPDSDEEILVLNIVIVGTVESVRERDKAFGWDFIAAIPAGKRLQIAVIPDIRSANESP